MPASARAAPWSRRCPGSAHGSGGLSVRASSASTNASKRSLLPPDRLAGLLPAEALEDALRGLEPEEITGPGGLLTQLAGRVIETALGAELTEHLGHPPGGVPQGPNVRNGAGRKTVNTDLGPVEVSTPRDRDGSFEPRLVGKRQTRLAGLDDKILGLYAGGMTVRDISEHLERALRRRDRARHRSRGSPTRCSRTSRRGAPGRWTRSIRSSTSTPDGQGPRGPLGAQPRLLPRARRHRRRRPRGPGDLVAGDRGRKVLAGRPQRPRATAASQTSSIGCVDGLNGFPEAIEAVFPQAWVQTCIVHQIRASLRYVTYRDRKQRRRRAAPDLHRRQRRRRARRAASASTSEWGAALPDDRRVVARALGTRRSRSSRCPPSCAARSTPPTRSRACTARSARRSRPAGSA